MFYKIVIGDSRDMKEVPSNSVQLVVTSPPYWNLDVFSKHWEEGAKNDLSRIESKEEFFKEITKVWKECWRVLEPGGVLVCEWEDYPVGSRIYGYPREIFLAGDMVRSIEQTGLHLISRWFWRKFETGVALKKFNYTMYDCLRNAVPRAIANVAYVFAFMKKELTPKERRLDFSRVEWKTWTDALWNIPAKPVPAEDLIAGGAVFPVKLVERIIRIYTYKGDTVLDPFLGTGTTMRACLNLRRSCIGYEVLSKMLPVIRRKVNYGLQPLTGEKIKWSVIER